MLVLFEMDASYPWSKSVITQYQYLGSMFLQYYLKNKLTLLYYLVNTCIKSYAGFLSGFWSRGVEMWCNVLLGGKLYYIPESKAYDELG